jgi:hypothetical protein
VADKASAAIFGLVPCQPLTNMCDSITSLSYMGASTRHYFYIKKKMHLSHPTSLTRQLSPPRRFCQHDAIQSLACDQRELLQPCFFINCCYLPLYSHLQGNKLFQ